MSATLSDPTLIAARDARFDRLTALFDARTPERPFYLRGVWAVAASDPYREPERWVREALDSLARQADSLRDPVVFRPLCLEFGPYGVHFIDRMFGSHVFEKDGQWWSTTLTSLIGALRHPNLEHDETWLLAKRIIEAFLAEGSTVPLFGTPTLSSALNIAVNLYGERFLIAMLDDPEAARRDLRTINDLLRTLHSWYRERIPESQLQPVVAADRCQPPEHGQLCGCSAHLLSAGTYRDFVAPLDEALLADYPHGGMIHLCGAHLQHLPTWRAMKSLRAVQLNDRAADDLEAYFYGLRDDQAIYLNPTTAMTSKRALAITEGRRLVIVEEPFDA